MSLRNLLEVDSKLLDERHERIMRLAESAWTEAGSPRERRALIGLLEHIIGGCSERGQEYPPVLLKRKKQLERGDWAPRQMTATTTPSPNCSHHPAIPDEWIRQAEEAWRAGK